MNNNMILRLRSKQEAKQRISEAFWATFAAGALYILPVFVLMMLTMLLPFVMEDYPVWMDGILYLAELLIVSPLAYGFGMYCVARSRGIQTPFYAVLEPLGSVRGYVRALAVALSIAIQVLPITLVRMLLIYSVPTDSAFYFIADLLIGIGSILESVLRLSMSAAYNLISDDPSIGSWRAVTQARELYAKSFFSVLSFMVSFIGWMILAVFSMGLLLPYLSAYQSVSFARMTDILRNPEPPAEDSM